MGSQTFRAVLSSRFSLKNKGFTLLEALVSLAIMASVGMALLAWLNTQLISLQRVQAAQQRDAAIRNALAFMDTINPLETPSGEETVGFYTFHWQAQPIELPKDGISLSGALSLYQVGLYLTEVEVKMKENRLAQFTLRQVGYKQARQSTWKDDNV